MQAGLLCVAVLSLLIISCFIVEESFPEVTSYFTAIPWQSI